LVDQEEDGLGSGLGLAEEGELEEDTSGSDDEEKCRAEAKLSHSRRVLVRWGRARDWKMSR